MGTSMALLLGSQRPCSSLFRGEECYHVDKVHVKESVLKADSQILNLGYKELQFLLLEYAC